MSLWNKNVSWMLALVMIWLLAGCSWIQDHANRYNWQFPAISEEDAALLDRLDVLNDSGRLQQLEDGLFQADSGFFRISGLKLLQGSWPAKPGQAVATVDSGHHPGDSIIAGGRPVQISGIVSAEEDWKNALFLYADVVETGENTTIYGNVPSGMEGGPALIPLSVTPVYHGHDPLSFWHESLAWMILVISCLGTVSGLTWLETESMKQTQYSLKILGLSQKQILNELFPMRKAWAAGCVFLLAAAWLLQKNPALWIWGAIVLMRRSVLLPLLLLSRQNKPRHVEGNTLFMRWLQVHWKKALWTGTISVFLFMGYDLILQQNKAMELFLLTQWTILSFTCMVCFLYSAVSAIKADTALLRCFQASHSWRLKMAGYSFLGETILALMCFFLFLLVGSFLIT